MQRSCQPGGHTCQLARHSQVEDKMKLLFESKQNPFATAADGLNSSPDQVGAPARLPRPTQIFLADPDSGNSATEQTRAQLSDDGLHLGQLRHGKYPSFPDDYKQPRPFAPREPARTQEATDGTRIQHGENQWFLHLFRVYSVFHPWLELRCCQRRAASRCQAGHIRQAGVDKDLMPQL